MTIRLIAMLAMSLLPTFAAAQDQATIQGLNEKFSKAFNAGDMATVASHYTDDAILLPPGSDLVKGRANIEKFWTAAAGQVSDLKLSAEDVKPLGTDAAREVGTFSLKTKGAQAQTVDGKYVVVWQKVGSDWKLATDIWNMNK